MKSLTRVAVLLMLASVAACGTDEGPASRSSPIAGDVPAPSAGTQPPSAAKGASQMKIQISVDGQVLEATLQDSPASQDLLAQLPLTIEMDDHGGVEKTGALPSPLSLDGQPAGADPSVGDVGYYAPGNDLVLYYGDQSYYDGIVVLGSMEGDAAEQLAELDGSITVTVDKLDT